jgi:hypothetical protein
MLFHIPSKYLAGLPHTLYVVLKVVQNSYSRLLKETAFNLTVKRLLGVINISILFLGSSFHLGNRKFG